MSKTIRSVPARRPAVLNRPGGTDQLIYKRRRSLELLMSEKTTEYLKVAGVNIFILLMLISLGNLIAITIDKTFQATKTKQYAKSHLLPNYEGISWARDHFREYDNLTKGYFTSFVGWRRPEFKGKTIKIGRHGRRRTVQRSDAKPTKIIALYGGSTMWGTGASDETTIPSFVAQKNPDYKALNFGETGYVAHQSFNRFFESYSAGFRPDVVVFYDGVNDVWNRCRREHTSFSHAREQTIRFYLKEKKDSSYLNAVAPMAELAGKINRTLSSRSQPQKGWFDCSEDRAKAERVARNLLYDWLLLKKLVEGYGRKFIAILQPHAYISKSHVDHLSLDLKLKDQYAAVYPLVVSLLPKEFPQLQENFLDLRTALDQDNYYFIDWCHLSPNGNEIIATRISERLPIEVGAR